MPSLSRILKVAAIAAALSAGGYAVSGTSASAAVVCRHGYCHHVRGGPHRWYWRHRYWREGAYWHGRYFHNGYWYAHRRHFCRHHDCGYSYYGPRVSLGVVF